MQTNISSLFFHQKTNLPLREFYRSFVSVLAAYKDDAEPLDIFRHLPFTCRG